MRIISLALLLCLMGCGTDVAKLNEGDSAEQEGGQALAASWFQTNLQPGSEREVAVLALVNDRSLNAAAFVKQCGFKRTAAGALVNYRQGDDPRDAADDERFDTIKELDTLPYTTAAFFQAAIECSTPYLPSAPTVCATGSSTVRQAPLTLEFLLDASCSMSDHNKWPAAVAALDEVFTAQAAKQDATLSVGLLTFDNWARVAPAAVTADQLTQLKAAIASPNPPGSNTPLAEAVRRGLVEVQRATGTRAIVLLTDGVPTGGATEQAEVLGLVRNNPGVQVFVVGIGRLPNTDGSYAPAFLGALAVMGGTRTSPSCDPNEVLDATKMCHFQVSPSVTSANKTRTDLLKAIDRIRANITSCDIGLQRIGIDPLDLTAIAVTVGDDVVRVPVQQSATDGWSLDNATTPTRVLLRGSACELLRSDLQKTAHVEVGCQKRCNPASCNTPPATTCADANTLRHFASAGTCDGTTNACTYLPTDERCEHGCEVNHCKPPPADQCTSLPTTKVTYDYVSPVDPWFSLAFDFDGTSGKLLTGNPRSLFTLTPTGQRVEVTTGAPLGSNTNLSSIFQQTDGSFLVTVGRDVYTWKPTGNVWTLVTQTTWEGIIYRDSLGRVWYPGQRNGRWVVVRREVNGTESEAVAISTSVHGLYLDEARGILYIAGYTSMLAVNVFDPFPTTTVLMDAASMGGFLLHPRGLAMDACGNLYVSHQLNGSNQLFRVGLSAAGTSVVGTPFIIADMPGYEANAIGRFGRGPGFDPRSIYWVSWKGLVRVPVGVTTR